jgi:hypothetical protein
MTVIILIIKFMSNICKAVSIPVIDFIHENFINKKFHQLINSAIIINIVFRRDFTL